MSILDRLATSSRPLGRPKACNRSPWTAWTSSSPGPASAWRPYRAILLKPVYATFNKNWARYAAIPTGTRIRSRDVDQ